VVFQPHRYTRTHLLYDRFMTCFNQADVLILAPLYGAGERPIEGVDSQKLQQGIRDHGHRDVVLCGDQDDISQVLLERVQKGDVVMTLGAGDIYHVGERLLEELARR
jgi:UDP-N-acetylmuramate--alanine ligase